MPLTVHLLVLCTESMEDTHWDLMGNDGNSLASKGPWQVPSLISQAQPHGFALWTPCCTHTWPSEACSCQIMQLTQQASQ